MAKYKYYDNLQKKMIAVDLGNQIMPGTLEFAIHILVETKMSVSIFDCKYKNDKTGASAINPKLLLKIILLAYSRGITTSRKIERACRENVTFMSISCSTVPDHSTIAAFVSSMRDQISSLFTDVLLICEEMKLLGGTCFALDGCKLPSNASRESSGTFDDLRKKKEKIEKKVQEKLSEQIEKDKEAAGDAESQESESEEKKREKQIKRLQAKADRIGKFLSENEPKQGKSGELKSNVTDNDSAKMVTSHGAIQGYNAQALVDSKHQVIVCADAGGAGQDNEHVPPLIDGAKANLKAIGYPEDHLEGKVLTADANYHSETNLKKCEKEKLDAFIPDANFRKRDPRFETQYRHKPGSTKKFTRSDFQYNEETDTYTCPNAKVLDLDTVKATDKKRNRTYKRYEAKESDCAECPFRANCLHGKQGKLRHLLVSVEEDERSRLSRKMIEKIDSEEGKKTYAQRLATVEPVFANVRHQKKLDRFTLRGKAKVNIQWMLYCMIHNLEKIVNFGTPLSANSIGA